MKPRVYLIDGSALAYRSYYAFADRPLVNSRGENTGAAYGVATTLLKLMREERPDYVAVVFDSREPTFRHLKFPEYKANRQKMPEEMQAQFPRILELVRAMGLTILELSGYEADDIMGTLARRFAGKGAEVVLVSADKDFCQLVGESIKVLNPGKAGEDRTWVDRSRVEERFGVGPERVVDVLALMGDSSDNIPGVPGVGGKTATRLVSKYGSLEDILARLPIQEEPRASQKLSEFSEQARLSRELASINQSVPIDVKMEDLRPGDGRSGELRALLEELEFKKLAAAIFDSGQPSLSWRELTTEDDVRAFEAESSRWKHYGLAVARGRDRFSPPLAVAVASPGGECFYVGLARPVGELFDAATGCAAEQGARGPELREPSSGGEGHSALRRLLARSDAECVVHDLKSALCCSSSTELRPGPAAFDVMLAGYLADPSSPSGLESLSKRILGSELDSLEAFVGRPKSRVSPEEVEPRKLGEFVCRRAHACARLREPLRAALRETGQERLYEEVELPLASVLYDMERTGVAVDLGFLKEMSRRLQREVEEAEREVFRLTGSSFNINSPFQLAKVLFEDLGLPVAKKTRGTGAPSTDEEVLEELAVSSRVAGLILTYRQLTKLKNTYVDVFPKMVNPSTGRLHASFNQAVTATGRLSMSEPNLQNIPARSDLGREVRKAFVPGHSGWILMSGDYSQVELRLLAHCSGDERLLRAFADGVDVHAATASSLFGVPPDRVPPDLRARAKVVNFGIIYGMSPYGLSRQLGIPASDAKEFIDNYYDLYPGVAAYVREVVERARSTGYAVTLLGRRRPIPGLESKNGRLRSEAERMAINTPIQGSAADMIKLAMLAVHRRLAERGARARLILQIHDELLLELPPDEKQEVTEVVRREMEHAMELRVPVEVGIGTGGTWFETH
ncbi:MAG: DNA polymerase I [Candidatus Eisenbacteria bacterium]|nr:DNA polymerase I [Candidatus Eisenbacteria bacterium]